MADPVQQGTPATCKQSLQVGRETKMMRESRDNWRALYESAEAEAKRLRAALASIEGVTMSMCLDHADMAERMRGKAREALANGG